MALRPSCCHEDLRRSGGAGGPEGSATEHRRTGLLEEWLKNCQYPPFPPALRTRPKLRRTMGAFSADRHAAVSCDSHPSFARSDGRLFRGSSRPGSGIDCCRGSAPAECNTEANHADAEDEMEDVIRCIDRDEVGDESWPTSSPYKKSMR